MSPTVNAKVTSPTSLEDKVQDGRVQKPRTKKKDGIVPNYSINGRTFACEGCKNGHRVSKCTHAEQRPVLMTNDPGRPSADQKRRCDCPKTCQCTKKNCKCDRNCTCMQTMYMLVYVPLGDKENGKEMQKGEWQIGRTIITDLKGKELTEEEIEIRRQEKSRPQQGRTSRRGTLNGVNGRAPSQDATTSFATPATVKAEEPVTLPVGTPKSGCCSRKGIQDPPPAVDVKKEDAAFVPAKRPRGHCTCGESCGCAICLDHPNNAASHRMIHQRAAELSNNGLSMRGSAIDQDHCTRAEAKILSCMGTIPQFAWHNKPDPSPADLQTLFGADNMADGGYFINYPVHGYSFGSTAPEGSYCSSSISSEPRALTTRQRSSQFPLFAGASAEVLTPSQLGPNHDFGTLPRFSEQVVSQTDFPPPLSLDGEMFPPEPYVGQATVAGVYGMADNWSEFCADQPIAPPWSSTSSDTEPPCIALSVTPDFKNHAASFCTTVAPGTLNHLDMTATTTSVPSKRQSVGGNELPRYETQYPYPFTKEHSLKPGYASPGTAPPSMYTTDDFARLELEPVDFFADIAALNSSYKFP